MAVAADDAHLPSDVVGAKPPQQPHTYVPGSCRMESEKKLICAGEEFSRASASPSD
jgi:hypothetical protein